MLMLEGLLFVIYCDWVGKLRLLLRLQLFRLSHLIIYIFFQVYLFFMPLSVTKVSPSWDGNFTEKNTSPTIYICIHILQRMHLFNLNNVFVFGYNPKINIILPEGHCSSLTLAKCCQQFSMINFHSLPCQMGLFSMQCSKILCHKFKVTGYLTVLLPRFLVTNLTILVLTLNPKTSILTRKEML